MPVSVADDCGVYDLDGKVPDHKPSPPIENERRLFYVALTRAVKSVTIGTRVPPRAGMQGESASVLPSRFVEEIQLEDTRSLISAVRQATTMRALSPGASLADELEELFSMFRAVKNRDLVRFVVEHYVSRISEESFFSRRLGWLDHADDEPFEYEYDYPDILPPPALVKEAPEVEEWSDPWDGIGQVF